MLKKLIEHFKRRVIHNKQGILGFGSKERTVSTLSGPQQQVMDTLGPNLINRLNNPEQFTGQLTAPITDAEQAEIANFNRIAALSRDALGGLINPDPAAFRQRFREEIADPSIQAFRRDIQPLIEEALPSFSTARGRAVSEGLGRLQEQLLQTRFGALESQRQKQLNAIREAQALGTTAIDVAGIPREIEQAGLGREFNRFVTESKINKSNVDSALRFLDIQTQATVRDPSKFSQFVEGAGSLIKFGSGIGSLVKELRERGQVDTEEVG